MKKTIHSAEQRVFVRLLRAARQEAGMGQVELAARLGETQSFVSKCERGERRLDVLEFLQVCRALGTKPSGFLDRLERELRAEKRA